MAKSSKKGTAPVTNTATAAEAGNVTANTLNPTALFAIAAATAKGEPSYLSAADGMALAQAGLIAPNPAQVDPNDANRVAVYLTEAGAAFVAEHAGDADTGSAERELTADDYELDDDVPLAPRKRGAGKAESKPRVAKYPFDRLEVGISFHIPVTAKQPEPWKSVNSAVSLATKSYDVPDLDEAGNEQHETVAVKKRGPDGKMVETGETVSRVKMKHTRVFTIRRVDESDKRGPGARVYREA